MKLWGGRFSEMTDERADAFHSSLPFDQRLYKQDINGSIAHAEMLGRLVLYAIEKNASLNELSLDEYNNISDVFDETVF